MLFYTICFTLPGRQAKQNSYVHCLMLLYKSLHTSGSLKGDDKFIVVCDEATCQYLRTLPLFAGVGYAIVPQPKTLKEGMALKYLLRLKGDELVVYCDTDLLARKPVRPVLDPDTLCVFPEGAPTDTNYCGEASTPLPLPAGFTAGFFAYRSGPRVYEFFDTILADLKRGGETFYTLDQPYFNRALVGRRIQVLPRTFVSFNGHGLKPETHLINLAGDPGDGEFHLTKQLGMYLALA